MFRVPGLPHLRHVLEAACRVDAAVGGIVGLFDVREGALMLEAIQGHGDAYAAEVARIPLDLETTCAQAARDRRQVVIRDVETDPAFAPHLHFARLGRFRSVQSTPMLDSERRLVGVLTTQFADPHHPSRASLQELEALGRLGALIVETQRLHESVVAADRVAGILERPLSAVGGQAAAAARMLITALGRDGGSALAAPAERHLLTVIDELTHHAKRRGTTVRAATVVV